MGVLLQARGEKNKMYYQQHTDSQVVDNLIGVIFAAHDTTASVLTWVLKYLHDNTNLLEAVTVTLFLSFIIQFYYQSIYIMSKLIIFLYLIYS